MPEDRKIRAGFIGCGGPAFRNIYPTFQFAPVDLIATCDLVEERSRAFARQFGALRHYTDHHEMLDGEDLDGVFIVTGYGTDNLPLYLPLAIGCMRAGCHVTSTTIEAPTAEGLWR